MKRILFVDRDGTIVEEPDDCQVDRYDKLRFVAGVVPALLALRDAGWQFVMVSNQDGLGTPGFPRESFEGPQALVLQFLESQGIRFREVLVDSSFEHECKPTRKPGVGMLLHYLRDRKVDIENSAVVGDRPTDLQLAANLGCRGYRVGPGHYDWAGLARELVGLPRRARVDRATRETTIRVDIDLDRPGEPAVATGIGFFDHLLEQLGKHGGFALSVSCTGDLHVDGHHTVEDCGLAIGQALRRALGGKHGVERYGQATDDGRLASITLPMDEARASAVLDLAGRPWFAFDGRFSREAVGGLATEMVPHFFRSMCDSAGFTLHLAMRGENAHHQAEACFKAVGRALRQAMRRDGSDVPSTKGAL